MEVSEYYRKEHGTKSEHKEMAVEEEAHGTELLRFS